MQRCLIVLFYCQQLFVAVSVTIMTSISFDNKCRASVTLKINLTTF